MTKEARKLVFLTCPLCDGCKQLLVCESCKKVVSKGERGVIVHGNINVIDIAAPNADGGGLVGDNFPAPSSSGSLEDHEPYDVRFLVGKMAFHLSCLGTMLTNSCDDVLKERK